MSTIEPSVRSRPAQVRRRMLAASGRAAVAGARNRRAQRLLFDAIRLNRPEFAALWGDENVRLLSYLFAHRDRSRSQILQDLWVCYELGEKTGGFFVEFGATNGLTNSNTWMLEHRWGWTGVLAEPNPFWHEALHANRSGRVDHRCVAATSGDAVPFLTTDDSDPELSGIASFATADHFADLRRRGRTIEVETVSLDDLLADHGVPARFDYLSVDTEGSEYEILRHLDFEAHRPTLISVEQNPATASALTALLGARGYLQVFPQFSQWDAWFVLAEHRRRPLPEFAAPRS